MRNMGYKGCWVNAATFACLFAISAVAQADSITFNGSSSGRQASVTFATSGSDLIVTLTNTATSSTPNASFVLTGVFFSMNPSVSLTRVAAEIAAGSNLAQAGQSDFAPTDTNANGLLDIGAEWAYKTGTNAFGSNQGIASVGLGGSNDFGSSNFPGSDLDNPLSPNGLNYGIVPAGFVNGEGNGGMHNDPFVRNSVRLTLSGLSAGFSTQSSISNVTFIYGTDLGIFDMPGTPGNPPGGETPPGVPLPAAAWAGFALLGGFGLKRRRLSKNV
jgi:hypothetical protein